MTAAIGPSSTKRISLKPRHVDGCGYAAHLCSICFAQELQLRYRARSSSRISDSLVDCCKDKIDQTDSIALHCRYLLHVDANTFCQQFRYFAMSTTIRDTIFERVYTVCNPVSMCFIPCYILYTLS